MAGTAQAAALINCDRCSGHYVVDASGDGKPRVRCNKCGHLREVPEPSPASIPGKWTVIGPDGKAMSFDTWEELTESRRPGAMHGHQDETKEIPKDRKSASALLDITPAPDRVPEKAKLALADMDGALDLGEIGARAKRTAMSTTLTSTPSAKLEPLLVRSFSQPPKTQHSPKVEWAPKIDKASIPAAAPAGPYSQEGTLRVEMAPSTVAAPTAAVTARVIEADRPTAPNVAAADDIDELDPDSLLEDTEDYEDEAPLSLKDAIPDSSGPTLGDDDLQEDDDPPDPHELLSIRDLVVVPAVTPSKAPKPSTPPQTKAVATSQAPPRPKSLSRPDVTTVRPPSVSISPDRSVDDIKRRDATAASTSPGPQRAWILGALALLVISGVAWRIASSSDTPPPKPTHPSATVATTAPVTPVTTPSALPTPPPPSSTDDIAVDLPPTPPPSATPPPTALIPSTPPDRPNTPTVNPTSPTPPTSVATEKPKPTVTDSAGSMSDLLDKAGAARRKGDYATARDLYQRVVAMSPGNVEANGGLGDVARAQGDLAAAKASYERALAASPTYTPAQLGLADVEWDQGNRPSATKRYAAVVDRMGDRAPQRAKERAGAGN